MRAKPRRARRPTRPKAIPRNGARRAGSVHIPVQAERFFTRALARMAQAFVSEARRILLPQVNDASRWPVGFTADAKDDPKAKDNAARAKATEAKLIAASDRAFAKQAIRAVSEQAARRVEAHSKDQFKRLGIDVKKEPDLKWLVNGWAKDVAARAKGLGEDQAKRLTDILGGAGARHAETVAKDIEEQLGVSTSRAEFLARDSIGTLNSKITRTRQEAAGIAFYIWTTVGDDRVRPEHEALDGQTFEVDGEGDPEEGHPGEPPNCFKGSTPIVLPNRVTGASRRWYDGELAKLVTDAGVAIECTPNHPILTTRGWLPAHAVDVGDHVFQVRAEVSRFSEVDAEDRHPEIAEVFDALSLLGVTERRGGAAMQFHGDGSSDQDVDVVAADRGLLLQDEPAFTERVGEFIFSEALVGAVASARGGAFAHGLVGLGLPATGIVRCLGERLTILRARLSHANEHCLAAVPGVHAGAHQEVLDCLALSPVLLRERLDRGALGVGTEALVLREAFAALRRQYVRRATSSAKDLAHTIAVRAEGRRDRSDRLPALEHPVRVVAKSSIKFSGHVFNLQTEEQWYGTDVVSHNCRCVAWPVPPEPGPEQDEQSDET